MMPDIAMAVQELYDLLMQAPNVSPQKKVELSVRYSFLQRLKEDTQLIVDNFNAIGSQDTFLDVMRKYHCRILFTTRSRYENHIRLEVGELNTGTLLELMRKFFPEAEKKQTEISQIIDLVHRNTYAVELAGRLLANGMLTPDTNF